MKSLEGLYNEPNCNILKVKECSYSETTIHKFQKLNFGILLRNNQQVVIRLTKIRMLKV